MIASSTGCRLVGLWDVLNVTDLIGRTGFNTKSSISDPTLCLTRIICVTTPWLPRMQRHDQSGRRRNHQLHVFVLELEQKCTRIQPIKYQY
jgi:hypothetical protein